MIAVSLLALAFSTLPPGGGAPPPEAEDDVRAWVRAAREGDREAARRLYVSHAAKVYRTVRGLCVSDAEAEDVTQETFAKAFEALDRYEARADARFVSWLLTIALNVARKQRRRTQRTKPASPERLAELGGASEAELPERAIDRATLRAALLEAMETALSEREREVISLQYGGELTSDEIAEKTGVSAANARKIAQRARTALRAAIERRLRPPTPLEDRP